MAYQRVVRSVVALALAGALAACNGSSSGSSSASDPTLPPAPSTTTTTAIDVSKVPPTIDVPYVQAVMDAVDSVTGDAVRAFVAQGGPNKEWYETFRAVFDEPFFSSIESDFGRYATNDLRPLRQPPGNPSTRVKRIVDASPRCVVAEVDRTYGPIYTTPPGSPEGFIQLRLKKMDRDPDSRNPTSWAVVSDVDAEDAQIPRDPCK